MLVQFRSPATETITMFGEAATQLLKLMGATGRVPGGLARKTCRRRCSGWNRPWKD